jgi:hypothetical protein
MFMADEIDKKISALESRTTIAGAEQMVVAYNGYNYKVTADSLRSFSNKTAVSAVYMRKNADATVEQPQLVVRLGDGTETVSGFLMAESEGSGGMITNTQFKKFNDAANLINKIAAQLGIATISEESDE